MVVRSSCCLRGDGAGLVAGAVTHPPKGFGITEVKWGRGGMGGPRRDAFGVVERVGGVWGRRP